MLKNKLIMHFKILIIYFVAIYLSAKVQVCSRVFNSALRSVFYKRKMLAFAFCVNFLIKIYSFVINSPLKIFFTLLPQCVPHSIYVCFAFLNYFLSKSSFAPLPHISVPKCVPHKNHCLPLRFCHNLTLKN